jgi:hypothetical protein
MRHSPFTISDLFETFEDENYEGGPGSSVPPRAPPLPKMGDLAVRVDIVGHASPRWRSAKNVAQAERLNQQLSEARAKTVRNAVEAILKAELPTLPIVVPSKGVGSQQRFPTASEDNAAIDRSVVVTVDLATTMTTYKTVPRRTRRIYVPSKVWVLRVIEMVRGAGVGYVQIFLRVALRNPYSGKEMKLSGYVRGGQSAMSFKDSFKFDRNLPSDQTIGREVAFQTSEALDFDTFLNSSQTIGVRLGKLELAVGLKTKLVYLAFTDLETSPKMLPFDIKPFGVGFLKADAFLTFGRLKREGENPGDYLELPSVPGLVETPTNRHVSDGLLLTFPTGKSGLSDLTPLDRKRLKDFVTNKARAIAALSDAFRTTAPRP